MWYDSTPMRATVNSRGYLKCAAECARLARRAPSPRSRQSFADAAKSWRMLAELEEHSTFTNPAEPADEFGGKAPQEQRARMAPARSCESDGLNPSLRLSAADGVPGCARRNGKTPLRAAVTL